MSPLRPAPAIAVFCLLSVHALDALAFCRARTCDVNDPKQACDTDDAGCVTTGAPLFWASSCVSFSVQQDGSPAHQIDAATATSVARRALGTWTAVDCDGELPSIGFADHGLITCDASEYNEDGYNANAIIFRDDVWPYPGALDTYGFTRLRFNRNTGEIYDADIEINSADFEISIGGEGVDLQSILTHEMGHFLGLAHTAPGLDDATMSTTWDGNGSALRSLSADDEAGMCSAYAPTRAVASRSCEPRHGFAKECNVPLENDDGGCSFVRTSARRVNTDYATSVALIAGVTWLLRRRRRT
jgi:hypothetical protein